MIDPLTYLHSGAGDWLIVEGKNAAADCHNWALKLSENLLKYGMGDSKPKILLLERDQVRICASIIAAVAAGCPLFLGNPDWEWRERQAVLDMVQPDIIWGEGDDRRWRRGDGEKVGSGSSLIMIPTGGSSGKVRFAVHSWETLMASVRGLAAHFQLSQINSCCCLPLYHVSGLMQLLRCFSTGGKLVVLSSYRDIGGKMGADVEWGEFFLSLVPTQLHRLLENGESAACLSGFQAVLLGGAPAWDDLLSRSRRQNIPLALTYGMTETASQVATLKPGEFLAGNNSCGRILPHAKITVRTPDRRALGANQTGMITIEADSLALGYYPDISLSAPDLYFSTDDLGFVDEAGYLYIVGRRSDKIITGGENVFPAEVEAAIRATGLVQDVGVLGLPDSDWGQAVVALCVPQEADVSPPQLAEAIAPRLTKYKRPKHWLLVASLPRNQQGKLNRQQLQEMALKHLSG
ncbi:MAG TPA: 2-succinylbenzoate--CoA ligase [Oscillatoriaceae cyanobacterium M33_DOE_052]|uniref:2-succinylbenzoate--CoA ligase n=1 Tax=Planktothricoides sp. SpSt-374 TaxID=2282167 RepID=A0A7C3ZXH1_9CYAN|nr:2-succinylbenzoate--CoA ligase [Oscillatoriaceae cyanobacterium M33_DOE_052]